MARSSGRQTIRAVRTIKGVSSPELQRDLFQISEGRNPGLRSFSNVLALWDLLPKYDVFGATRRYHSDLLADNQVRVIPVRHQIPHDALLNDGEDVFIDLELHITPALIERKRIVWLDETDSVTGKIKTKKVYARDEKGNYIYDYAYVYPGLREDKIEEALKMLLSHGQGEFKSDQTGVMFSLKQIQKELRKHGSMFSLDEIKESLTVLSKARCDIYGLDANGRKKSVISSPFLPALAMVDRDTYEAKLQANEETACYAQFHLLVTLGIQEHKFKLTNYEKHQRLDNLLSRFIHKILRINFSNASLAGHAYRLSMYKTLEEFGRISSRKDNDRPVFITALNELKRENIISDFVEEDPVKNPDDQRLIIDRYFRIFPSQDFVEEMIRANARSKENQAKLEDLVNVSFISEQVSKLNRAQKDIYQQLRLMEFTATAALEIVEMYDVDTLEQALQETHLKMSTSKVSNPQGYLIAGLQEGYFSKKSTLSSSSATTAQSQPQTTINVDQLEKLNDQQKEFVINQWKLWSPGTKGAFNMFGLASPAIQEILEEKGLL